MRIWITRPLKDKLRANLQVSSWALRGRQQFLVTLPSQVIWTFKCVRHCKIDMAEPVLFVMQLVCDSQHRRFVNVEVSCKPPGVHQWHMPNLDQHVRWSKVEERRGRESGQSRSTSSSRCGCTHLQEAQQQARLPSCSRLCTTLGKSSESQISYISAILVSCIFAIPVSRWLMFCEWVDRDACPILGGQAVQIWDILHLLL